MPKPQRIQLGESPNPLSTPNAGANRANRRAALIAIRARIGEVRFESRCNALPREARYDDPLPVWVPDPDPT